MHKEIRLFFTALMFYSQIPVPASTGFSEDNLNKSTRYFPLVGIIVGMAGGLVFTAFHAFLPLHVSVLSALIIMILLTGAFHEDAFADFCDGFGGGYSPNQILNIMKDSRIGVYGALGLAAAIPAKLLLLISIEPGHIPLVMIAAHSFSRVSPVILIYTSQYVQADTHSKAKPIGKRSSISTLWTAVIIGVIPLAVLPWMCIVFIFAVSALTFTMFRKYVHKRLGGYTGDVLGALQQLSEMGFYLAFVLCRGAAV